MNRLEKLRAVKAEIRELLEAWRAERVKEDQVTVDEHPPRYDEVFHKGTAWLNSL